jgi:hypothetical protein
VSVNLGMNSEPIENLLGKKLQEYGPVKRYCIKFVPMLGSPLGSYFSVPALLNKIRDTVLHRVPVNSVL